MHKRAALVQRWEEVERWYKKVQEDGLRTRPTLESAERQQIQRANQIILQLKKLLHNRVEQFAESDVREAAQARDG